ncbi:AAA family ATPase [Fretibacter rubidus]|uniref:AAA family ATPase n=1 Tax=Fretibacter rubidus TaxID=570162 RepID=UPI00352A7B2C
MMTQHNQNTRAAAYPSPTPQGTPQMAPAAAPAPAHPGIAPQAVPSPAPQMPRAPMPAPAPQQGYAPQPQHQPQHQPQMAPPAHRPHAPAPQMAPQMPPQMPPQMSPTGHMPTAMPAPVAAPPAMAVTEDIAREGGEKALPSISIHAFCDRPDTAGAINQTQNDWRMKRTNLKIYMGGLPAAIDFYHKESTPGTIMIETGMRGPELFAQLEQLASVCDAGTKVVVIGAANDIRLYRQLMDQGVSDYLVPPLSPMTIIHALGDIYADPEQPFVGRVAAFFGAKGGVGSSTLAHNIAWCLSERIGKETALVDLDASWGTTGLDFAYDNSQGLEEALAEPDRLDETLLDRIMIRHTPKLSILPAAGSLGSNPVMTPDAYEAVVDAVRSVSPLTILDMPHYWSDWTTRVLTGCDDIVISATPDLASLRNTKNLIDFLRAKRPNDPDPILILNCVGMVKTGEISVKDFGATVGLDPAVTLGFDPMSFTEAMNDGKMLTDIKSASAHVSGCEYVASRLATGRFPVMSNSKSSGPLGFLSAGKGSKDKASKASGGSILSKLTKKK